MFIPSERELGDNDNRQQIKVQAKRFMASVHLHPVDVEGAQRLAQTCHMQVVKAGWWHDLETGLLKPANVPEKLCLTHSEISEAMEGHRAGAMDKHLPHRKSIEVELADAVCRIFDLAGHLDLDVIGALVEKLMYNAQRPDHKPENRAQEGGKKY